jgi:hypothetical protein
MRLTWDAGQPIPDINHLSAPCHFLALQHEQKNETGKPDDVVWL